MNAPAPTAAPWAGYACALAATLIWAGNFPIARGLAGEVPPVGLAWWRWAVACMGLLPFVLRELPALVALLRERFAYLSLTAVLGISIFNTLIYFGASSTGATNLALVAISSPVFMILLARAALGEAITRRRAVGTLVTLSGVLLLISGGSLQRLLGLQFALGDLLMLCAAACFAGYTLLVRTRPAGVSALGFLFLLFALGLAYLSPLYLWEHLSVGPFPLDARTLPAMLYIGLGASIAAFALWNRAVQAIGAVSAGLVYYLVPLFTSLLAWVFLDEAVTWIHGASLALIAGGILHAQRTPARG